VSSSESIKTEEIRHAEEALQAILKAKRNLRLYPANNPIYSQMASDTYRKVMSFFDFGDIMELTISRSDIKLGPDVVYHSDGKEDNLALFLFRDGLRTLTLNSGLREDELLDFMDVISTDFDAEGMEDDLITMLWEKEFQNISYMIDDSDLMDEDESYQEEAETQAREDANEEGNVGRAYEEAMEDDAPAEGIVPISVTEDDLKALESEFEGEKKSKFPKLVEILFDMLYSSDSIDEFKDVTDIISNAVNFCVRHANLSVAIGIFRRVREVLERTKTPEAKKELEKLLAFAGSPALIKTIGEWLDSKKGINEAVFKEYVSILGPSSIPHFISLLAGLETIAGRKAAVYALSVIGRKDFKTLAKGLGDKRWFVVRNIIVTFRSIGDKRALDYLPKVINHSEPRVRKEVIKLYGEMGGPGAVVHISEHLYSKDHLVEVVTAQALSKTGSDMAKTALIEKVTSKGFQELDLSRMKPFFEALARFRSMDVIDFLMKMLDKNPLLGRTKYNEMKACAVYALGLIGSTKALPVLEEQRAAKDKIVSGHATAAINRIQDARRK
jgi:HEAT repeat protein